MQDHEKPGLMFLGIFPSAIWSHLAYVLAPVLLLLTLLAERIGALAGRHAPGAERVWAALCVVGCVAALAVAAHISVDLRRWHPEALGGAKAC